MRSSRTSLRFAAAVLLVLLLAVRSLAPAGFMPAFDGGTLTIVSCPDFAPPASHHHKSEQQNRAGQPCPYAAAASVAGLAPSLAGLVALLFFPVPLLLGSAGTLVFVQTRRERPPSRGPPLPA